MVQDFPMCLSKQNTCSLYIACGARKLSRGSLGMLIVWLQVPALVGAVGCVLGQATLSALLK